MLVISDVTFCIKAPERVPSRGGGVSAIRVLKLASFRDGMKTMPSEASLHHVTDSGSAVRVSPRVGWRVAERVRLQHNFYR